MTKSKKRWIKAELWDECKICGICKKDLPGLKLSTLDHIIPLGKGGKDIKENLQLTHWKCNNDKGDNYSETGT